MSDYAYIQLDLGKTLGHALILRDRLPQIGARLKIEGRCWEVEEAQYGFRRWSGIEGQVICTPC